MIKIEKDEKQKTKNEDKKVLKQEIKLEIEKYLKDPVFMALVKKYAKESEEFNKNKSKIDKEHDKIIKRVFQSKKEAARFISKVIERKIKPRDLIVSQNSFVTSELRYREADIVYKIRNKNVVILIEHQTRVDYRMAYRILNYQIEIMRANEVENPRKEDKECLVIPIVLYTGKEKWTAKNYIKEIQERLYEEKIIKRGEIELGTLGYYALVDVNNYTKEELLKEEGILSKIMLIEKERNTKDLVRTMFEIKEKIQNDKNKEVVYTTMELALNKKFGTKVARKIMEKIIGKESGDMLAVEEMVLKENKMLRDEGRKIGISEGKKIGISEGKLIGIDEGIIRVAKEMLKNGVDDEYVEKYTHLSKEKIEKLKKEIHKM